MTRLSIVAALLVGLAACGGTPRTAAPLPDPPADDRTEIERRRDAACEALGPRLTECAIADAHRAGSPPTAPVPVPVPVPGPGPVVVERPLQPQPTASSTSTTATCFMRRIYRLARGRAIHAGA